MLCPNGTVKPFLVSLVEPVAYLKSELRHLGILFVDKPAWTHRERGAIKPANEDVVGGKLRVTKPGKELEDEDGECEERGHPFQEPIGGTLEFHWHPGTF